MMENLMREQELKRLEEQHHQEEIKMKLKEQAEEERKRREIQKQKEWMATMEKKLEDERQQMIKDREEKKDLFVDVLRFQTVVGHSTLGYHNWPNQTGIGVVHLRYMAVVHPQLTAQIIWAWPSVLWHIPHVGERSVGTDGVVRLLRTLCAVVVICTLGVFGVKDAVRMH